MTGRETLVATYYQILFELLIFVAFVIVLKIVMLLLMEKLAVVLSDNPEKTKQERARRKAKTTFDQTSMQKWLRFGMGLLVTVSGLLQVQPRMVGVSQTALSTELGFRYAIAPVQGLAHSFASAWAAHSIWMNVTSCGLQLLVGLVLLTTSNRVAVLITAAFGGVLALIDFVWMTGFGGLLSADASVLGPSTLRGLVYLVMFSLFFLPVKVWQKKAMPSRLLVGVSVYWIVGALLQVLPENGFWQSIGWNRLLETKSSAGLVPVWTHQFAAATASGLGAVPLLSNVIVSAIFIALAVITFVQRNHPHVSRVIPVVSFIWLGLLWVFFSHFGFENVYVFPMDSGPAMALAILLIELGQRASADSSP